jgi:hypothetical protein
MATPPPPAPPQPAECEQLGSCLFPSICSGPSTPTRYTTIVTFINVQYHRYVIFGTCDGDSITKTLARGSKRISVPTAIGISYECTCNNHRINCTQIKCESFNNALAAHKEKVRKAIETNTYNQSTRGDGKYCSSRDPCRPQDGFYTSQMFYFDSSASEAGKICVGGGCSC